MNRFERVLMNQKASIVTIGVGVPSKSEGGEGHFTLRKVTGGLVLYIKFGNIWYDVNSLTVSPTKVGVPTFPNSVATPSVKGGTIFNGGLISNTITDFMNGDIGQTITVITSTPGGTITYDVTGTNLKGGSTDIVTAEGDTTTWIYDGASWYLISWMDISGNLADGSDGF